MWEDRAAWTGSQRSILLENNTPGGKPPGVCKYIVEFEQGGEVKAKYGAKLLENLSHDLTLSLGKGFSRPNLSDMRLFYLRYPICQEFTYKLIQSHYCELTSIDNDTGYKVRE